MGREVLITSVPKRIVSLVPSQTELLYHLGLDSEVVGITKFCIHPESWFNQKKRIGGTKKIDPEAIRALKPDLIIGNKEENTAEDVQALTEIAPIWMSDIYNLNDALEMIWSVGQLTGTSDKANELVERIRVQFQELDKKIKEQQYELKKVLYFIWYKPNMLAGQYTFINDMLQRCGWINIERRDRYPEAVGTESPDLILLSSEPFPFNEKHKQELQILYPKAMIISVDGEMFSWYGSHLLKAPEYFGKLLDEVALK